MAKIEITHLSFGYDGQGTALFTDANLIIDTQWKLGLIGRNGRGKTTFLQLLMGKIPHQGTIKHQQIFQYFPQKISDKQQLTYHIIQELSNCQQWEIERELRLLSVDPAILWRPFGSLSGGEQTKVLLALLFTTEGVFSLIDEPTNHLDQPSRLQVANYLKQKKHGFIVVSHDRTFIDIVVDHIVAIEKKQIEVYQGNFSVYEEQKNRKDAVEWKQNEKRKKEVIRLKQTAKEKAEWAQEKEEDKHGNPLKKGSGSVSDKGFIGARAARTMKRAKSLSTRMNREVAEKAQLLKNIEHIEPLTMNYRKDYHHCLLSLEQLSLSYEQQPLFQPLTVLLHEGERLAITGRNGSGKTAIIQAIQGDFKGSLSGVVAYPKKLNISYVRQNYEENTGSLQDFSTQMGLDYQLFLTNLHKLGLERSAFHTKIEQMSMGQKKKVELAKSLAQPASLYIWDEPLNYLDVFNQKQLAQLLITVKPTILLIEHDPTFLTKVTTQRIELKELAKSD